MNKKNQSKTNENNNVIPVTTNDMEVRMISLRQQPVLLDCDIAALYGVRTKEINQAVRNNPNKFPPGYIFLLDDKEKNEVVKNFDRLNNLKYSTVPPTAFNHRHQQVIFSCEKEKCPNLGHFPFW